MEWKAIAETADENGKETSWYTKINNHFWWIELTEKNTYAITQGIYTRQYKTLIECKSLASAKRWVTQNYRKHE